MKNILKQTLEATATGIANILVIALILPITLLVVVSGVGASLQHPIKEETENENDNKQP